MLLIDAFNVLHTTGVLPPELAGPDLPELAALIAQSRYAGESVVLACDGVCPGAGHAGPAATAIGDIRVLYAGAGREADDEIERLLAASTAPRRLVVVSDDRRLRRAARRRGARSMRNARLLADLAHDAGRRESEPLPKWVHEIPLGPVETERWLRAFGIDPGALEEGGDGEAGGEPGSAGDAGRAEPPEPAEEGPAGGGPPEPEAVEPPTPPPLDEESKRLLEEHGIDPRELDMDRWLRDR